MSFSLNRITKILGCTDGQTYVSMDGQPENIMPPASVGGGDIINRAYQSCFPLLQLRLEGCDEGRSPHGGRLDHMVLNQDLDIVRRGEDGQVGVLVAGEWEVDVLPVTLHLGQSLSQNGHSIDIFSSLPMMFLISHKYWLSNYYM